MFTIATWNINSVRLRAALVERLLREVTICRIAPVSEQLVLSFIAERVLGQPKSY